MLKLLKQILPGQRNPRVPIFLAQASPEQEIPPTVSAQLEARYCRLGATVIRRFYPGANHDGVLDAAMTDALAWIDNRYNQRPASSDR